MTRLPFRVPGAPTIVIATATAVIVFFFALWLLQCQPVEAPAAAEAAYTAELLNCVDKAATLRESKACRAEVDKKWGIVQVERKAADAVAQ